MKGSVGLERTLKLVGKSSNEVFLLRYPTTLMVFCEYDFSYFAEHSVDLCNESLKSGAVDVDRMAELRREIQTAHCYIEHNVRMTSEKVALDCWIDYVCRRDSIGVNALWNRFIRCKSDFEKAVFSRLCDFRYNRAINEWLNIVRVQDYAKSKIDFIFVNDIKSVEEAVARRNYFDLMFSVTAREMGCRIEDLGVTKTFSVGRTPNAPFMFPNVSKDIVRSVLSDFDYSEDFSDVDDYGVVSDKLAMDAFSRMKAGLPQDLSTYSISRGKLDNFAEKIYMPCSLKAAVDLEIDAMIENGEWLGHCKRCGRYFLRGKDHPYEYCTRVVPNGKTCLELWQEENPKPTMSAELEKKCREVMDKVYARVDKTMSVKEYEYWHSYLEAMMQKVKNGEISSEELESFLNYSLNVDITKSTPIKEVPKKEPEAVQAPKERVVKPFVPERISRESLAAPQQPQPLDPEDERVLKEGFFTSPKKQRRKNEKPQISHIIRNGESLGSEPAPNRPDPAGFQPFGAPISAAPPQPPQAPLQRDDHEELERLEESRRKKREKAEQIARQREIDEREQTRQNAFEVVAEPKAFVEEFPIKAARAMSETPFEPDEEPPFRIYDDIPEEMKNEVRSRKTEKKPLEIPAPKTKVIKKNAAAISAYGKAAGAPVISAPVKDIVIPRDEDYPSGFEEDMPESEPFKDIGSIFDVLEQSDGGRPAKPAPSEREELEEPQYVTKENAPSGIWTEDRGLFEDTKQPESPEPEPSELDMLRSKKHNRSNKTRRLYDVILREPDDNPNFTKKKK